jgi:hypothetical protein
MNGTMYETENGIIYKASINASKYVDGLIQRAIEDGKLVKVVRCGECKHRNTKYCAMGNDERSILDDDYCSNGVRRER